MKNILIIIISFFIISCNPKDKEVIKIITYDTLIVEKIKTDSTEINKLILLIDSLNQKNIILNQKNDSLNTKLFRSKFALRRIKYYVAICMKNPSQDKFLKGWIRVITDVK